MGVGAAKRFGGMQWTVVERIVWAWIFTPGPRPVSVRVYIFYRTPRRIRKKGEIRIRKTGTQETE